jgi:hypothetical protein
MYVPNGRSYNTSSGKTQTPMMFNYLGLYEILHHEGRRIESGKMDIVVVEHR